MHRLHAKDGLVAMSVNLDDPRDARVMRLVRDFLQEQKAEFANYVLDEDIEEWQKKLGIAGAPAVFLFGRDGKAAKKYDAEVDYKEISKAALELLKQKE